MDAADDPNLPQATSSSDRDPLDFVERNLLIAPVVKLGRPRGEKWFAIAWRLLACRRCAVMRWRGRYGSQFASLSLRPWRAAGSCGRRPAATWAACRSCGPVVRNSGPSASPAMPAGGDVGVQIFFQVVVAGQLVLLAALLMQPHPSAARRTKQSRTFIFGSPH